MCRSLNMSVETSAITAARRRVLRMVGLMLALVLTAAGFGLVHWYLTAPLVEKPLIQPILWGYIILCAIVGMIFFALKEPLAAGLIHISTGLVYMIYAFHQYATGGLAAVVDLLIGTLVVGVGFFELGHIRYVMRLVRKLRAKTFA